MNRVALATLLLAACRTPPGPTATPFLPTASCPTPDTIAVTSTPYENGVQGFALTLDTALPGPTTVSCTLLEAPAHWQQLVSFGTVWRYLDDGPDPGIVFTVADYDDREWSSGPAPLGAGDDVATTIQAPRSATLFRTSFQVDDPEQVVALRLALRRDDGIAVFVNGTEVYRDNLPEGPIDRQTHATVAVERIAEHELVSVDVAPVHLLPGKNVLAVALHDESYAANADATFDLRLAGKFAFSQATMGETHHLASETTGTHHEMSVFGLLSEATYACEAASECGAATFQLQTAPLDVPMPPLALRPGINTPTGAYTLFNHQRPCINDYANRLVLVDPEGRVRWTHELPVDGPSSIDVESRHLGDGVFLWGGGEHTAGRPHLVTLDHTVVHQAAYPGVDDHLWHHDVEWLDGEVLGLLYSEVEDSGERWEAFDLLRYDTDSQAVTWQWSAQEAFDRGDLPTARDGADPYHANALASVDDADGKGVYVTLLYEDAVIRIDEATGAISWWLGRGRDFAGVDAEGTPLADGDWFDGTHAITMTGPSSFLLYENGRSALQSRIIAWSLDTETRVATRTWTWTEHGWYEPVWGDVDELPNGHVLVAMAHNYKLGGNPSHPGALLEIDPTDGSVPWRLDFLDVNDATYRAERIDGCALFANGRYCPALTP